MNKKTGMWFIGGLVALILGMALCTPGGGCEGGPGGGPGGPGGGPGGIPGGPEGGPEEGGGPGGPGSVSGGIGPGPGADRVGGPAEGGRGIPEYEVFPVPGESIPLGCAPVTVTPREEKPRRERGTGERETGRGPSGVGGAKGTYGARISGNPSAEQMQITQTALAKIEEKYPGLLQGRQIEFRQRVPDGANAVTMQGGRRVILGPETFQYGTDKAIYIIAHEFGHVHAYWVGKRLERIEHELYADKFATDLLGYSFPTRETREAMGGGGMGGRGSERRGGRGMMGGVIMENPELEAIT